MERTKSSPFRLMLWAGGWLARSGTSWWPLGAQKSRLGVGFHFFEVHFGVSVAHGKSHFFNLWTIFWCPRVVPRVPWRRQMEVSVRFELPLERTKSRTFRRLPWARRWLAQSGTSWRPIGAQKSRVGVGFYFFVVHFGVLVAHGKSRFF